MYIRRFYLPSFGSPNYGMALLVYQTWPPRSHLWKHPQRHTQVCFIISLGLLPLTPHVSEHAWLVSALVENWVNGYGEGLD